MNPSTIALEIIDDVALLTLNAPETLNALSEEMLKELNEAMDQLHVDKSVRCFVLTGSGRGFCSGAALGGDSEEPEPASDRASMIRHQMIENFNPLIRKIYELPIPTIAAVNGIAAGGGVGLALSCDLVIASEESKFALVFTPQLGLIPDLGAAWHFSRAFGRQQTLGFAYFGTPVPAAKALEAGLIWRTAAPDRVLVEAMDAARHLASGPTQAYAAVRNSVDAAHIVSLADQLALEADIQPNLAATSDFVEGVTAFLQKRAPVFTGK